MPIADHRRSPHPDLIREGHFLSRATQPLGGRVTPRHGPTSPARSANCSRWERSSWSKGGEGSHERGRLGVREPLPRKLTYVGR